MALVDNNDSPDFEAAEEALLTGIREAAKPFQWGQPKGVQVVTVAEQEALAERIAEGQAAALAEVQRLAEVSAAETAEHANRFEDALESLVTAKTAEVPLLPPNPMTASRAETLRWEEKVRADERARIELAANPPDDGELPDSGYFDDFDEATETVVDVDDEGDTDGLYDPAELNEEYNFDSLGE